MHEFPREVSFRGVYGYRRVTGLNEKTFVEGKTAMSSLEKSPAARLSAISFVSAGCAPRAKSVVFGIATQ
jgi:hypothetical protein